MSLKQEVREAGNEGKGTHLRTVRILVMKDITTTGSQVSHLY